MNSCCNNLDHVSAAATSFLSVSCGNIFPYGQLLQQPWLPPPLWSVTPTTMATSSPMVNHSSNHGHILPYGQLLQQPWPHPPLWSVTPATMATSSPMVSHSSNHGYILPYGQLLQQPWPHPPLWSVTLTTMVTSSPSVSSCNNPDHISAAFTFSVMASYSNNHGHFHMRPHPPLWSVTPTTMAIFSCDHILSYGQLLRQPWPCFSGDHTLRYGHAVTPTTIAIFSFGRVLP